MYTFTSSKAFFGTLTNNSSASNLILGGTLINQADKDIINSRNWDFLETSKYTSTVAGQQFYDLPYDYKIMKSLLVNVSSILYAPQEASNRDFWNYINESTVVTSDIPEYFYESEGSVGLWPIPTSVNTMTMEYALKRKDLSMEDYVTGSVNSVSNGSTTVTFNGTALTSKMNGFWLKIADSELGNTGDGVWYQIDTVDSTTSLTLRKPYGGISISSGTATYIIGQCSLIPEDYQEVSVYKAAQVYFTFYNPDAERAKMATGLYQEKMAIMLGNEVNKNTNPVVSDESQSPRENNNLFVRY